MDAKYFKHIEKRTNRWFCHECEAWRGLIKKSDKFVCEECGTVLNDGTIWRSDQKLPDGV